MEPQSGSATGDGERIREHLANERTLLSWVRTGVTLISIGLVVERTGALVQASSVQAGPLNASALFGLALVLLGMVTLVMGTTQFVRTRRRISTDDFVPAATAYLVVVAGSLVLAAAFVVYVLLSS